MKNNRIIAFPVYAIFSLFLSQGMVAQTFTVSGHKLMDANGNEFVIRGMNVPFAWHFDRSMKDLKMMSEMNINCIRIVWDTKGKPNALKKTVKKIVGLKMVPMIELHDATGDTTKENLLRLAKYYAQPAIKKVLLPMEKYLLVNIANEWGNHNTTGEFWNECYREAISILRDAGYKTTIVIDAPGWGQNIEPIQKYGKELTGSDPLKNLLFSVHMYYYWNDARKIDTELDKTISMDLPLIVGEFGYNFDKGFNNLDCKVDHTMVLKKCNELGIGYLPWSWTGNNKDNAWLDVAEFRGKDALTWWGRQVIESEAGIRKNAERASVFTE